MPSLPGAKLNLDADMQLFHADDILRSILNNSPVYQRAEIVGALVIALSGYELGEPLLNVDVDALAVVDAVVKELAGSAAKTAEILPALQRAWRQG